MEYTDIVLDHARNPRNVGFIEDHDGMGTYGDPSCGDFAVMTIKVRDEQLLDVRYMIRGCGAAIATCSMASELVKRKSVGEAQKLTDEDVAEALGGLPPEKLHCSNLAATALHSAIEDYYERQRTDLHNWRALYNKPAR
ncbi:MAG: iron-sulfur cluster assembly scaffold protein [Chloroflexota bacterium]|nr:iron-sulfur cluster assembly scaffold protein [Chloroflexota bacterium]